MDHEPLGELSCARGESATRLHRSMQKFVITGGVPLSGEVRIAGAKNAVLKQMAAAVLTDELCTLRNVPKISDVAILREVMGDIGFEVRRTNGDGLELRAREVTWPFGRSRRASRCGPASSCLDRCLRASAA